MDLTIQVHEKSYPTEICSQHQMKSDLLDICFIATCRVLMTWSVTTIIQLIGSEIFQITHFQFYLTIFIIKMIIIRSRLIVIKRNEMMNYKDIILLYENKGRDKNLVNILYDRCEFLRYWKVYFWSFENTGYIVLQLQSAKWRCF